MVVSTDMAELAQPTFVDAAALVGVLDRTSPEHFFLGEMWRMAIDARSTPLTTDGTVFKVALELQTKFGLAAVERFFRDVSPVLRVERCREADMTVAVASLPAAGDPDHDLVEHIEETIRTRLRITQTLAGVSSR